MCLCVGIVEARRGHWVPLELELLWVVSCLTWVLRTKIESSASALNLIRHFASRFLFIFSQHSDHYLLSICEKIQVLLLDLH